MKGSKEMDCSQQVEIKELKGCLGFFDDKGFSVKEIFLSGRGKSSNTYIVRTSTNKDFALSVNVNCSHQTNIKFYRRFIQIKHPFLVDVYDARINDKGQICVVMEALKPIPEEQAQFIKLVNTVFSLKEECNIGEWVKDNLNYNLLEKISELAEYFSFTAADKPKFRCNRFDMLLIFKNTWHTHRNFINIWDAALKKYYEVTGIGYWDFHPRNLMRDSKGNYKLIDLYPGRTYSSYSYEINLYV